ncbi:uncharacterized protein LOC119095854 isoform X2 [Pollicipes pollicipes]|nr:uncharacterized protein LOC119095854 isoform X2 [Pollicipes pollicipes]XP_037074621.1 uncharacterized protein LOC119095854 isoform X2 [Pollicipes pollicipes]
MKVQFTKEPLQPYLCATKKWKRLFVWLLSVVISSSMVGVLLSCSLFLHAMVSSQSEHYASNSQHAGLPSSPVELSRPPPPTALTMTGHCQLERPAAAWPAGALGDFPHNASAPETAACLARLGRALGRRLHLALVGDSRSRGLYSHLRRRWRLPAHTRNGTDCLTHFVYKNRTDWCHYRASSPLVDLVRAGGRRGLAARAGWLGRD